MKAMIVYDSVFGNTAKIAREIGATLGSDDNVEVLKVTDADPSHLDKLDLLIVGSPTRGFRSTPAIRAFLKKIPTKSLENVNVAAFDTRISLNDVNSKFLNFMVARFGYAAEPIAAQLHNKQGTPIGDPEGFYVADTEGPLKDGELNRAAEWAQILLSKCQ